VPVGVSPNFKPSVMPDMKQWLGINSNFKQQSFQEDLGMEIMVN